MKIAISGGGLSGLILAITLQKNGIDYHIYESSSEDDLAKSAILLSTNSLQVLERLGIAGKVINKGYSLDYLALLSQSGGLLTKTETKYFEEKYGYGTSVIHQKELKKIFLEKIPKDKISSSVPEL